VTGRLQMWLQGCGPHYPERPWIMWRLGNFLSDLRYYTWKLRGSP
jgi:hypothetical protein